MKIFRKCVAFALVAGMLAVGAQAANQVSGAGVINASGVNFRAEASTSAKKLGTFQKGGAVVILDKNDDWYHVIYNGTEGYVYAKYVTTSDEEVDADLGAGSVTGNSVRVRKGASTSTGIVKTVNKGQAVTVIGVDGSWYHVKVDGSEGYIRSDYVTITGETADTDTDTASADTGSSTSTDTGYGKVNVSAVNMRSGAGTSNKVVTVIKKGETVKMEGLSDGWYKVTYNDKEGYIKSTYITPLADDSTSSYPVTGTIIGSSVNMRSGASTKKSVLKVLAKNTTLTVNGEDGEFYKVEYNGTSGYVCKAYVSLGAKVSSTGSTDNSSSGSSSGSGSSTSESRAVTGGTSGYGTSENLVGAVSTGNSTIDAIVASAESYLGVPYVYGGTSPSGFDCSGFTYYVYKENGITIKRTASAQARQGTSVSRDELQIGDLIFFDNNFNGSVDHVGIYLGNGYFIHASSGSSKRKVVISSITTDNYYSSHYLCAVRIVE